MKRGRSTGELPGTLPFRHRAGSATRRARHGVANCDANRLRGQARPFGAARGRRNPPGSTLLPAMATASRGGAERFPRRAGLAALNIAVEKPTSHY
jgi:hypothetical protein